MIVKVCGLRSPENIAAVESLGVDMVGFIFYDRSPRYVSGDLPDTRCWRVGVFVDESFDQIVETADKYHLTHIQLHGGETSDLCKQLRACGLKVIKSLSNDDIARGSEYESCVDLLLFDTKCSGYGGSGVQFDWSVLENYRGQTPFLLSGGIRPESLQALQHFRHPQFVGVDLNSGFEQEPAVKDIEKLKQFISKIR